MAQAFEPRLARRTKALTSSAIREILKVATRPDIISFAGGLPAPELFPISEITAASARVLEQEPVKSLQYGPTDGVPELRAWVASEVTRAEGDACKRAGLSAPPAVTPEMVMITTGSQQSLDLISKLFIDEDDQVLVESPSYLGALQAFTLYQPRFITAAMDEDGVIAEAFAAAMASRPKLAYLLPTFQNPTGRTMSTERRQQVAAIVRDGDVPLVEDDPYGALYFDAPPGPSLRSLAPDKTLALGTFSKTLAPGLRIGWLVGPTHVVARLIQLKQSADLHTSSLAQYVAYEVATTGALPGHLDRLRQVYAVRRDAMLGAMEDTFPTGVSWTKPTGGMFVWATLPAGIEAAQWLPICVDQQRVAFVPGAPFHADGTGKNTLRMNFTHAPPEVIAEGVGRLAKVLRRAVEEAVPA